MSAPGKHYEGTLRPYVEQVAKLRDQVEAITDRIQISADVAERVVKRVVYEPKQGGLPARRMGLGQSSGLSKFFTRPSQPTIELS